MKTTLASLLAITALFVAGCGAPDTIDHPGRAEEGIAITGLFPTGVDGAGAVLAQGAGEIHYTLLVNPDPTNKTIQKTKPHPLWIPDTTTAGWISNVSDSSMNTSAPLIYTFRLTFTLANVNPTTATITGKWAADNSGVLTLNAGTANAKIISSTALATSFSALTTFTVAAGATSGLVLGTNTLDFVVTNDPPGNNPMGVIVSQISGTAYCQADTDCPAGMWCNNLATDQTAAVCTATTANGTAVPGNSCATTAPPVAGSIGARACASGACDSADNICGIATGDATCTLMNGATVCRSTFCSTNGTCKATATSCNADGDCTTAEFCNTAINTCTAKAANGVAIPANAVCTGATTTTAGTSNGCVSGTCGTDGICGTPNEAGGCRSSSAATICRSGVCDPAGGTAGLCHQCTATSSTACTGTTPICGSDFVCAACNADNGTTAASGATAACGAATPYCPGGGTGCTTCGTAGGTTTCTAGGATHSGGICQSSGACGNSCTQDTSCTTQQFCNTVTSACTADLPNGTLIPTIAGHTPVLDGQCTIGAGNAVCATHVCDTADKKCGFADGHGACTADPTVCRSGVCSANGACVASGGCNVDADCSTVQFCNTTTNACVAKAVTTAAVPATAGACPAGGTSNGCLSGTCDAMSNTCGYKNDAGPCTTANAGGTGGTCQSGVCDPAKNGGLGFCEQCTSSSAAACTGMTPICDSTADTCVACNGDNGAGTSAACPSTTNPYCPGGGGACATCGTIGAMAACTATGATHAGMTCQVNGSCANACATDANCMTGTQYCDNNLVPSASTCVADVPNGGAIPINPLHNPILAALCTPAVGASVCASGVCDTDGKCGYANGDGLCTASTGAKVCRSGFCSSNGTCKATATSCNADGDCATTQFCNTTTNACVNKVANGVTIPANATCVGATATAAGTSKGCTSNTCGTDGICGTPNGAGGCTSLNAGTACRSGVCDPALNAGAGFCEQCTKSSHAACTGATVCNASSDTCTVCNGDNSTLATATCGTTSPYCPGGGAACTSCGTVGGTTTCAAAGAIHAGNTCIASGACSTGCATDANCTAGTQFCDTGAMPVATCTADLANGVAIPTIAGHTPTLNGQCTLLAGAAVCASHVCDTIDQACGYADGHGTCTPATSTTVCRSGACSNSGTCVRSGGCNVDGDCTTVEWCDTTTSTCEARAATGATIPRNGSCTAGASDRCLSGGCDSDNVCGHASGKGPCAVATEAGTSGDCRTQICDGASSLCAQCTTSDSSLCPTGSTCSNDACALATPVITGPADGTTIPAGPTSILGTGTPGATITVRVDGTVVGTVTVDNTGHWALPMSTTLDGGTHTITAVATAGSGISAVTSATATATVTVTGAAGDMGKPGDMGTKTPDMASTQAGRDGISGGGFGCSMTTQPVDLQLGAALLVLALLFVGLLRRRALRS